jgi:hypothetical protein
MTTYLTTDELAGKIKYDARWPVMPSGTALESLPDTPSCRSFPSSVTSICPLANNLRQRYFLTPTLGNN